MGDQDRPLRSGTR